MQWICVGVSVALGSRRCTAAVSRRRPLAAAVSWRSQRSSTASRAPTRDAFHNAVHRTVGALSLAYIFLVRASEKSGRSQLPPYPDTGWAREALSWSWAKSIIPSGRNRSRTPRWLIDPGPGPLHRDRGLRRDRQRQDERLHVPVRRTASRLPRSRSERRIGGLVLEVKGDFCHKVAGILEKHGRAEDYVEVSLDSPTGTTRSTTTSMPTRWPTASPVS